MFDYFSWKSEIADVMFAFTQLMDNLSDAEKTGGFERAAALLKRLGRNERDRETVDERLVAVSMPLPKHHFEVAISKTRGGDCQITITGLRRYAGFSLLSALPSHRLFVDLHSDSDRGRASWRARKLFVAIREHQRAAA